MGEMWRFGCRFQFTLEYLSKVSFAATLFVQMLACGGVQREKSVLVTPSNPCESGYNVTYLSDSLFNMMSNQSVLATTLLCFCITPGFDLIRGSPIIKMIT